MNMGTRLGDITVGQAVDAYLNVVAVVVILFCLGWLTYGLFCMCRRVIRGTRQ